MVGKLVEEKMLVDETEFSSFACFVSAVGLVLETFPIEEFNPTKGGV